MRLYLSSFRMGSCPGRIADLTRGGMKAVVIANAMDAYPHGVRSEGVKRELDALTHLGFQAEELDLRDDLDDHLVEGHLRRHDLVWIRGGDVFTLRHSLLVSGAGGALKRLLADDAIAYGGYSAGACVLAPTLHGLEEVDDPALVKRLYEVEPTWDGLGLLDYCIVPHVESPDHPESQACDRLLERYRASGMPHRALRDGQVLIIDGDREETCSG